MPATGARDQATDGPGTGLLAWAQGLRNPGGSPVRAAGARPAPLHQPPEGGMLASDEA